MKKISVRNPIYGFSRIPIIDKIKSGQLEEISYIGGEGIVETKKLARQS